jgi:Reverse transcriptase (RNA-dependent DNA polymerase)
MKVIIEKYPKIDFSDHDDEDVIKERIKACIETSRQTRQNAHELRQQFLEEWADIAKQNGNLSLEAAIRQIQNIEATKRNFTVIGRIMERNQFKKGLSMIKVKNESTGEYETVVNTKDIEKLLLQRNQNHYAQANGTFMATSEMRGNIGSSGTSEFCDNILNGTLNSQAYPRAVKAIFKELSKSNNATVNEVISLEDFKDAMRRWKETTSTSPSGRHLGHYISLLTKIGDDTDELGEKILSLHHKMLNIAQYRGQPYERWKSEVEIMLEKEPGDPKIDRLRIICLYEADYNLFLKIMWAHRLVTVAEKQNLFDDCQGGGRPNRTSNDVAVRKMLTYAYSQVTRTNFACMDLDAKSCYDRIVASFALLCSRRFGMPKTACNIHGISIDQMKHYVKTALGISKAFFESSPEKVLYGSGQGSSGSPSLWIVVSAILFRALEAIVGVSAKFPNLDGSTIATTTTTAFVDDTTNFINSILRAMFDDEHDLSNRLQEQTQAWEELLSTSGGKLELPKCLAYLVVYDFVDGEPTQRPKSKLSSEIRITDSTTGETVNIDIKDPAESHKTLGGWQNPAGNSLQQAKILELKERKMAAYFSYMRLFKYRVHLAYNSMYTKSLQFPLGVTMMTYETANQISMRTTQAIIGAMGLNRQAPRQIVFAPTSKLGLGLKHHYMVQGTKHVKQLVSHVRQQDTNGKLYKATLEFSQLLAGTTTPLLQHPHRTISYFSDPFVSGVRKFLSESDLNIVIPDLKIPTATREHDRPIMESILTSRATKQELKYTNQCRLFFQVFWLSEICDPDGKSLEQNYVNFNDIHHLPSFSTIMWPFQPPPSRKAFNVWKKLIRKTFLSDKQGRSRNMKLEEPLGKFYNRERQRTWHWEWDGVDTVTQKFIVEKTTIAINFKAVIGRAITIQQTQPTQQTQPAPTRQTIPLKIIRQTASEITFRKERVSLTEPIRNEEARTSNNWEDILLKHHTTIHPTNEAELWLKTDTSFCIGICVRNAGTQVSFGWVISVRTEGQGRVAKMGVGKVPKTNQHDTLCTRELIALHAALYLL